MTIELPALNIILQMLLNGILIDHDELINHREELLVNKLFSFLENLLRNFNLDFNE